MDQKTSGIVSYLTLIGWIVVLVTRKDKTEYTSFHLRQMLGIMVLSLGIAILGFFIGKISWLLASLWSIVNLVPLILWIIALIGAVNEEKKLVPVVGEQFQEWFKSI